jgi:hypothetical protein
MWFFFARVPRAKKNTKNFHPDDHHGPLNSSSSIGPILHLENKYTVTGFPSGQIRQIFLLKRYPVLLNVTRCYPPGSELMVPACQPLAILPGKPKRKKTALPFLAE